MSTTMEKPVAPLDESAQLTLALTEREADQLRRCEAVIEQGLKTFYHVGTALTTIRDGRLHRTEHKTFEAYLAARWGMKRAYGYRLMSAVETVNGLGAADLSPIGDILPANEAQARPLLQLPAEEVPAAWIDAVRSAGDGPVTAAHVERAVDARLSGRPVPAASPDVPLFTLDDESGELDDESAELDDESGEAAGPRHVGESEAVDKESEAVDAEAIPLGDQDVQAQDDEASEADGRLPEPVRAGDSAADVAGDGLRQPDVAPPFPGAAPTAVAPGVDAAGLGADADSATAVLPPPQAAPPAARETVKPPAEDRAEKRARDERAKADLLARHEAAKAHLQALQGERGAQIAAALAVLGDGLTGVAEAIPAGGPAARALAVIVAQALGGVSGVVLSEAIDGLGLPVDYDVLDDGWEDFSECIAEFARCDGAALIRLALEALVRDEVLCMDADHLLVPSLDWYAPVPTAADEAPRPALPSAVPVRGASASEGVTSVSEGVTSVPAAALLIGVFGPGENDEACARCQAQIEPATVALLSATEGAGEEPVRAVDGTLLTPHAVFYCPECAPDVAMCRVCGCTDESGCDDGCYWVAEDLCSTCVPDDPQPDAPALVLEKTPEGDGFTGVAETTVAEDRADRQTRRLNLLQAVARGEDVPESEIAAAERELAAEGGGALLRDKWDHSQAVRRGAAPSWDAHCRVTVTYGGEARPGGIIALTMDHSPRKYGSDESGWESEIEWRGPDRGWFSETGYLHGSVRPDRGRFATPYEYAQAYADWEFAQSLLPKKKRSRKGFEADVAAGLVDLGKDSHPDIKGSHPGVPQSSATPPPVHRTAFLPPDVLAAYTEPCVNACGKIGGKDGVVSRPVTFEGGLWAVVSTSFLPGGGREATACRLVPRTEWTGPINLFKQSVNTYYGMPVETPTGGIVLSGEYVDFKADAGIRAAVLPAPAPLRPGGDPSAPLSEPGAFLTGSHSAPEDAQQDDTLVAEGLMKPYPDEISVEASLRRDGPAGDGVPCADCGVPGHYVKTVGHRYTASRYCPQCADDGGRHEATLWPHALPGHQPYEAGQRVEVRKSRFRADLWTLGTMVVSNYNIFEVLADADEKPQWFTLENVRPVMEATETGTAEAGMTSGIPRNTGSDHENTGSDHENTGTGHEADEDDARCGMCKAVIAGAVVRELCDIAGAYRTDVRARDGTLLATGGAILCPSCAPPVLCAVHSEKDPCAPEPDLCRLCGKKPANFFGTCDECDGTFHEASNRQEAA